jgi:electron transfer flavoprotein beta subunit
MKIIVCCKFTPDIRDIEADADGLIHPEKAELVISDYDLQALCEAERLAGEGHTVAALSAGTSRIDASRLNKDLLSRGAGELHLIIDDRLAAADSYTVGKILAAAVKKLEGELVLCGEGSADLYSQQTGIQIGGQLGWLTLNGVDGVHLEGERLTIKRVADGMIETLEAHPPAVLCLTSGINTPQTPTMRAVLQAGKKPVRKWSADELGVGVSASGVQTVSEIASQTAERKGEILAGDENDAVTELVNRLAGMGLLQ